MSKKYSNTKSGFNVVSGKIKSISDDKMTAVIEVYNAKEKKNEDIAVVTASPIEDEKVGDVITATGYNVRGQIQAEVFSKDAIYTEVAPVASQKVGMAVLAGNVLFASYNDEIDKETNEPKLSQAGTPRKPHFDITVAVGSGTDRVTHTVKIYDIPARQKEDGTMIPKQENIKKYKDAFAKFDRETNPYYVSIITQPGTSWIKKTPDKIKPEIIWENQMMSHLGANSIDITYMREYVKAKETPVIDKVPTVAPTPIEEVKEEVSGFDASGISLDDNEDFGIEN